MTGSQEGIERAVLYREEMGRRVDEGLDEATLRVPLDDAPFLTLWSRERLERLGRMGAAVGFFVDLDEEVLVYELLPSQTPKEVIDDVYEFLGQVVKAGSELRADQVIGVRGIPKALFKLYPDLEERFQPNSSGQIILEDTEIDSLHLLAFGLYQMYGRKYALSPTPDKFLQ